jgi:hypothetical protein
VDSNQAEIVAALRKAGCEVLSLAAVGNGCPDLLILAPDGELKLVELKDGNKPPSKQKLTPHQVAFHKRWPVSVVTNWAEALNVVAWRKSW